MSKILFLTTAHHYNDDRILYHQAKELVSLGDEVMICSLSSDFKGFFEGVKIDSTNILAKSSSEKAKVFLQVCDDFQPDCIICSEPLAVLTANKYSKKKKISLIYDITEWYPSMRMVKNYGFPFNYFHALKFFLVQLYAGFVSDYYIFGEVTKKFPLAYFFPWKKKTILPYYPDNIYIQKNIKKLVPNAITLCYTGSFSKEKGIGNFFKAIDFLQKKRPNLTIEIILVGGTRSKEDEKYFSNLISQYPQENIKIEKPVSFNTFTNSYANADICFDLREINLENNHCLPIKIFYYIASGKPVIYSNLKATNQHMNVSEFGYLVDPENSEIIASQILKYVDNHHLYDEHANNARKAFEEKYNWGEIRHSFSSFVKKSLKK